MSVINVWRYRNTGDPTTPAVRLPDGNVPTERGIGAGRTHACVAEQQPDGY